MLCVGCEVEFSPNAEWKETPVVYCVLDQGDDTTWVRVEKCYLSEGDIYRYGSVSDSINYPAGSLQVTLLAIKDGQRVDSMDFTYDVRDHSDGDFAWEQQPVYWCYTRRRLREDCYYKLVVRRAADGSTLATATTNLVTKKNESDQVVTSPNDNTPFGFSINRSYCKIEWRALNGARLYQPIVRFYYTVYGDTLFLDLPCNKMVSRPNANSYNINYSREGFLSTLHRYFDGDTTTKGYPQFFDIFITACNEDLHAYMNSVSSGTNLDQGHEVYTNIKDGEGRNCLGVFGARRTHIYRRVPGDPSDREGIGLHALLKEMGVGFI